jgi:Thermolysin metallopeptidase, alpha-helical domain
MRKPLRQQWGLAVVAALAANLDVHYSSGVGNHFFYLLSEGSGAKTIGGVAQQQHDLQHHLPGGPDRLAQRGPGPVRRRFRAAQRGRRRLERGLGELNTRAPHAARTAHAVRAVSCVGRSSQSSSERTSEGTSTECSFSASSGMTSRARALVEDMTTGAAAPSR